MGEYHSDQGSSGHVRARGVPRCLRRCHGGAKQAKQCLSPHTNQPGPSPSSQSLSHMVGQTLRPAPGACCALVEELQTS